MMTKSLLRMSLIVGLLLSACGVVAVQIEEPIPTVNPTDTPIPPPPIQAEASAGLVAREAPDDSEVLVKTVAMPHIVYMPQGLALEMFEQWTPPVEYLAVDRGRGLRLRVDWSALWLVDSYGVGQVSMDVLLRAPGENDFRFAQNATTSDFEGWGADQRDELLDSTLYLTDIGDYQVRAEVEVSARNDQSVEDLRSYTYEFNLVALNYPPKLLTTPEDFTPQFGDLENAGALLDWRGWRLGPCFIRTDDLPEAATSISEACVGFANGDWEAASAALQVALQQVNHPVLRSRIYQQLGTLSAVMGDWPQALIHFQQGLQASLILHDALEVSIALRNLGIAQKNTEQYDEGEINLWQSIQLSDQIEDWLGSALTYGQFGYYWESLDTLEWVTNVMQDNGLPQAEILRRWSALFRAGQAP